MNYGRAIRIAMGAADVRGTDLALAIGMSPSSISLVCMGRRGISLDKLDLIAKAFDMPRFVLDLLAEGPEQVDAAGATIALRWMVSANGLHTPAKDDTIIETATTTEEHDGTDTADLHGNGHPSAGIPVPVDQDS